MTVFKAVIEKQPEGYDHDNVRWLNEAGEQIGFGYRGREDGRLHVQRCPKCGKENYVMAVATGHCAWCGFDANTTL